MSRLIEDDMLRTLAVHGTPAQCAAEIARRFPDCDRICAYFPFYPVTDELIAEFVDAVRRHHTSDDGVPVLFGLGPKFS